MNPAQKVVKGELYRIVGYDWFWISGSLFPTAADLNKDGVIDLKEAASFVNKEVEVSGEVPDWFKRMDTNKDGVIQPLELDKDYYYGSGKEGEESSDTQWSSN